MSSRYHPFYILLLVFLAFGLVQAANNLSAQAEGDSFDCANVTQIPQSECEALVAFYDSTNGDNWGNNSDWLETNTPCSWFRVNCSGGHVIRLRLYENQLSGVLPPELSSLPNLTELVFHNNQFGGEIPPELGTLSNLTVLHLHNNHLSGTIPVELSDLSNLSWLYLSGNQLSGSIPPQLGNLTNLIQLGLQANQLNGTIPPELGNLTNLTWLYMANNELTGSIPPELGNLVNLTALYLYRNQLSGTIPAELGNLAELRVLYLCCNQLTGEIPAQLANLTHLYWLMLHQNQLSGPIPAELGNLSELETLSVYRNQLTGNIPPELGNMTNLVVLRLHWNQLSGEIPPELGNLANVSILYLDRNQLSGIVPPELGNLNNLTRLTLFSNPLSGPLPLSFASLTELFHFAFYHTNLCEPPDPVFQQWISNVPEVHGTGVLCEKPPIVLLPGIMGSRLTNIPTCSSRPAGEIWPGLLHLVDPTPPRDPLYYNKRVKSLHLKLNENGTGVVPANDCDNITATGVFTQFYLPGIYQDDYYQQFLDDLANEGYEIYAFAYDWRLDLEEIAQTLDNYLITTVGAPEVILVGHSLGGLVARQYTANATRAQRVEKVISVGTPYWGAPLAAMHMRRGTIPVDQLNYLLKNADVRDFHRNSPAVMQILPSPAYHQQAPPYFIYNHTWFHLYTTTTNFFKDNGQTGTLLDQARDLHNAIDNFNNALHVPYYILTANHSNAVTLVREYDCWLGLGRCWVPLAYARGDGTVPWDSARLSGLAGDWSGAAEVCTFTIGTVTKEHSQLLADSNVMADVKRIIQGEAPQYCVGPSTLATLTSEPDSFIQVALWGVVRATVTDSQGYSAYLNEDGLLINEIPLASYQAAEHSIFITLPASNTYTLTLAQESDLPLQLHLSDFKSESVEDTYQAQVRAIFIDVPSAEGGLATLSLDLADDLSTLQLLVDLNNDGNPDHVLPPSTVLDAEESQDITMPVTTIITQGTPGELGFYTGIVTVTLTASDVGTGVFKTEYSLDGGATWQLYIEPISFAAEDAPIFYARSVDRAGNAEFPWPRERLQPHSLFLPTIQR